MAARDEAISNALPFENSDIASWLKNVSGADKGALAVQVKDLTEQNKALIKRLTPLVDAEAKAWKTVDGIIEAWERRQGSAEMRGGQG